MRTRSIAAPLFAVAGFVMVGAINGAEQTGDRARQQARTTCSWDSPKTLRIERTWRKMELPPGTDVNRTLWVRTEQLVDLLKKGLSRDELAQLAASCATLPAREEDESQFALTLPPVLVLACVELGDRDALVMLLASRYPKLLFPGCDTEGVVVGSGGIDGLLLHIEAECGRPKGSHFRGDLETAIAHGFQRDKVIGKEDADLLERAIKWYNDHKEKYRLGAKFTDPILILTDAYSKSKDKANRQAIAVALRHAFIGLGVIGKNDDEFVANAVQWYKKNKGRITFNHDYALNAATGGVLHNYDTNPLFILGTPRGNSTGTGVF